MSAAITVVFTVSTEKSGGAHGKPLRNEGQETSGNFFFCCPKQPDCDK